MDNVMAGLHQPQPFLYIVKDAWKPFLSSRNGLCQVDSLTAPLANATQREATDRAFCAKKTKQLTAHGPVSTVCTASLRKSAEPAYWPRRAPALGQRCTRAGERSAGGQRAAEIWIRGLPKLSKHDHLILKCPQDP